MDINKQQSDSVQNNHEVFVFAQFFCVPLIHWFSKLALLQKKNKKKQLLRICKVSICLQLV